MELKPIFPPFPRGAARDVTPRWSLAVQVQDLNRDRRERSGAAVSKIAGKAALTFTGKSPVTPVTPEPKRKRQPYKW